MRNRKNKAVFKMPKREKMVSRSIECWKCSESILAKPYFLNGVKKFQYFDKDGSEHKCL